MDWGEGYRDSILPGCVVQERITARAMVTSAGRAQILVCRSHLLSSVKTYVGTQGSRNVMSPIVIMEVIRLSLSI
jgi:hypothetical protein